MCRRVADRHAREWLGDEEAIPGPQHPGLLRMRVKDADGVAGELGQLHRSGLDLVDRAAWAVRGKDRRMPSLNCLGQRPRPLPPDRVLDPRAVRKPSRSMVRAISSPSKLRLIRTAGLNRAWK